jgi:hypothetical protein
MKKKTKVTRTRVNKAAVALAEYKALGLAYAKSIRFRKSVEHSRTPSICRNEGKTGPATVLVNELITVVLTASKLDKLVVLGVNGDSLVVLLEDKVPQPPCQMFY